ncbi:hypothetical protein HJG60_008285 [Phyllostomus discolor]|uniref:Uncharacterized protein n=1 Tax=Phyllostomus discolor TaxID=89673 RepID=A0A833ZB43_9CHIR|nr:hypothetical protein HJG60_008285 [Phyllostomus discolor]
MGLDPNVVFFFLLSLFLFFFKDFIYLFLEGRGKKKRGREKERERNINVQLPLECPQLGNWPTTQACALTGNQTSDPVFNPLSHTSQGWTLTSLIQFRRIQNKESARTHTPKQFFPNAYDSDCSVFL